MTQTNTVEYEVVIVRRTFQMTGDDYHATVTRNYDGAQLIFIAKWLWLLRWSTRRIELDRAFRRYDDHQAKLAKVLRMIR